MRFSLLGFCMERYTFAIMSDYEDINELGGCCFRPWLPTTLIGLSILNVGSSGWQHYQDQATMVVIDRDLTQKQLTSDIPRLIWLNEVLQYFGLWGNLLTGTLSPDMCQLTGLWYFDVRGNNISGTILDNIGNCTSYEILSLQGNRLTGKIPEVIGLMQALVVL